MECQKGKPNITLVANIVLERKIIGRTFVNLIRYLKLRIKGTICNKGLIIIYIIESALGDLKDALANNILN
jgi:hypothetical protein